VLLIITFRPEFIAPWVGRSHVTLLSLRRLPRRQCVEMIARVTRGKALPKEFADQIVDRTDGVPLFIEELTKTVVESSVVSEAGDHYAVAGTTAPLAIPTSLHASLLARLDRLAPTREVAQIGSALGRSFAHELIAAVAVMPQDKLNDALIGRLIHCYDTSPREPVTLVANAKRFRMAPLIANRNPSLDSCLTALSVTVHLQ
jgi:predicted ATPase